MKETITSHKFWATVITALVVILNKKLGLDLGKQEVLELVALASVYVGARAYSATK